MRALSSVAKRGSGPVAYEMMAQLWAKDYNTGYIHGYLTMAFEVQYGNRVRRYSALGINRTSLIGVQLEACPVLGIESGGNPFRSEYETQVWFVLLVGSAGQHTPSGPRVVTLPNAAPSWEPAQLGSHGTVWYEIFQTPKSL